MNLLERYLQAVGQYLPIKSKGDTLAELRANLLAEIEGREEELGRSLNEGEVAALLAKHGAPAVVAARYLPQQYLIGPGLFALYWFTLVKSLPLVLLAYCAAQGVSFLFGSQTPSFEAAIGHLPGVLFTFWSVMTLGFAVFEFAQARYFTGVRWTHRFDPKDLPELNRVKGPSFANRVADFVVNGLMLLWVLAVPTHPYLILGPGGTVHGMPFGLSPEWRIFYWQIVGLLSVMLALKFCIVFARSMNWIKGLGLVTQTVSLLILVVIVQARTYFVYVPGHGLPNAETLASLNYTVSLGFKVALAIASIKLAVDLWQMFVGPRSTQGGVVRVF
ncbi:MAG TPA: hypothetical protein VNU92_14455 [Edaphobacter sp.]|jgi:hypothetical protein|nr:hypothetical protein [Edaphobacter sp.]